MSRQRKFALRSVDVRRNLDVFLVCAVASVLGNRAFLIATGYPQVGNGTLHISHAIWGALMLAVAVIAAISYLTPSVRLFVAFLGGAGFGWFIDELGKFITRKVNYFFQPTIALIYIVFITMYLVFRSIAGRAFTADEAVLNGLEAVKAASLGRLDETRRREALQGIVSSHASGSVADHVVALLRDVPALPPRQRGPWQTRGDRARSWYRRTTERPGFARLVSAIFVVLALYTFASAFVVAFDHSSIHGFSEWASVVSGTVAGVLIIIGAIRLPRSRVAGYRWFERGMLVNILVTQVFVFEQRQLAGLPTLVFDVVLWLMAAAALRAERERAVLAGDTDRDPAHPLDGDQASREVRAVP
ncbi:MAG: hypothetical protein ABWY77_01360 [Acidimicrobiia bacterium]